MTFKGIIDNKLIAYVNLSIWVFYHTFQISGHSVIIVQSADEPDFSFY